jgi:hypothetical protein
LEWKHLGLSINGGCAAEHEGAALVLLHGGSQNPAAIEIDIPVEEWVGYRFAHGLETGEMNDAINGTTTIKSVIHRV